MRRYVARAWKDTRAALGGWPALVSLVLFPIIGLALHFFLDGKEAMSAEAYIWALYVLTPLGVGLLLCFVFNLVAAPYRFQKERAEGAERKLAELLSENLPAGAREVPWYLKQVLTFRQCQVFAAGTANIQVLFPWDLRCPPTLSWGRSDSLDFTHHDIAISDLNERSITIKFSDSYLRKRSLEGTLKMLKELNPQIDADSGEGLATAARKFGFGDAEDGDRQAYRLIVEALSDPAKGYPYLLRAASDRPVV